MRRHDMVVILDRKEMKDMSNGKDIRVISIEDFKPESIQILRNTAVALFIDDNDETKILKNRFGDKGEGMFIKSFNDIRNTIEDSNIMRTQVTPEFVDDVINIYKINET